jgi:putative ABC transport system permease protein
VSFLALVFGNVWGKKARSAGLVFAVAIAVMTVVGLTVLSKGLTDSATAVLRTGKADFTVAQKGVSDILFSNIDQGQLARIRQTPGVKSVVGVLIETEKLNAANPLFLEIGIAPDELRQFGVTVVSGHPYGTDAAHEMMIGWRAAENFHKHVGDTLFANGTMNRIVGIYSTGISFGDLGSMFPLPAIQAYNRVPGAVTLLFVQVNHGASVAAVEHRIDYQNPELTTISTAAQFGRADRNIVFLNAASTSSTILAIVIGAIIVANTMLLSLFERTREFGLLRAIGWARRRVVLLVVDEGLVLALIGTAVGILASYIATGLLQSLPQLRGVLHASYSSSVLLRGLGTAVGMTVLGTLYPALRAAMLSPLEALSRE